MTYAQEEVNFNACMGNVCMYVEILNCEKTTKLKICQIISDNEYKHACWG